MQRVVGNAQRANDGPDLFLVPFGQGIELVEAEGGVVFFERQFAAGRRLRPALPGDPGTASGQRALERRDLADLATGAAQRHALVEGISAMLGDVALDRPGIGPVHGHLAPVAFAHRVQYAQRLGMQPARVQREHLQVRAAGIQRMRQKHVLGGQRRRQRGIGVAPPDVGQALVQFVPADGERRIELGGKFGRRHACTAKMRARRGRARRISPSRRPSSRYKDSGTSASRSEDESSRVSSRYALGPAR
ncbi:hypothetical protein D9M68_560290 [compost metagenome]